MKKEIKEKWLTALRSGEYQQTKGVLQCGGKYCCLGVLSDIYAKENDVQWQKGETDSVKCRLHHNTEVMPLEVIKWAGLSDMNPLVRVQGFDKPLAEINDEGMSFLEIADIIEQQL